MAVKMSMLNPLPTKNLQLNDVFGACNLVHESGNQKLIHGYSQFMAKKFQANIHGAWEEALCPVSLQGNFDTFT